MRAFRRDSSFDLAINLWTAFGYFDDEQENMAVLRNVYASLADNGVFVLEMAGKETIAAKFQPRDWQEKDDTFVLQERTVRDSWSRIDVRWIALKDGQRHDWCASTWLYSAKELSDVLRQAGFRTVQTFGGFDGSPYDPQAKRLVAVARK